MDDPAADAPTDVPQRARPSIGLILGVLLAVAGIGLVAVAFFGQDTTEPLSLTPTSGVAGSSAVTSNLGAVTTAPLGDAGLGEGFASERDGRSPLRGFGEVQATITAADGTTCEVCLLAAQSVDQRARGLMEVTDPDLGGYDGMVFIYPNEVSGAFWMRNTPMPLSIAYFDGDGTLVTALDMEPCEDSTSCPSYPPDGPFQYALEVPQGQLDEVGVVGEATITIDGTPCPLAAQGG